MSNDYDWAKDAARSYDLAISECRARALRGEPVTIGGKPVDLRSEHQKRISQAMKMWWRRRKAREARDREDKGRRD